MVPDDAEEIRCEILPIPSSSGVSRHALFFHQFTEQVTDSAHNTNIPSCSVHHDNVAAVQCMDCVKHGLPAKWSYHCSNKCFLDAWKKHVSYHLCANVSHSFNGDIKPLGKLKRYSWPPGDMISWFDERVEVVLPSGKKFVNGMGSTNIFVPLADDVALSLKLGSTVLDRLQVALSAKDVLVTDPALHRPSLSPLCVICHADLQNSEKKLSGVGSFNVLTYNILSDIYACKEKYFYCPRWALTWEYRRENLLREIILYDADILCLQEVQSDHFENFFKPKLANYGYSVIYKKKTIEVYTGNGYNIDGCAIFFRKDIFKEVIAFELEFSNTALSVIGKLELNQRDKARMRLVKGNIALAVVLEMVGNASVHAQSSSRLCVVNTHIHAGSPDVKLLQVSHLLNEIEKTIDPRIPVLICGDINSVPGRGLRKSYALTLRSAEASLEALCDPYVLLANNEVNPASGKVAPDPLGIYQHLKLRHSMKLASAYTSQFLKPADNIGHKRVMVDPKTGEPLFTRLIPYHKSTLDYIFYTVDSLEVEGLLDLPDYDSLGRALPTPLWSSDHVALMAKFRIKSPLDP